ERSCRLQREWRRRNDTVVAPRRPRQQHRAGRGHASCGGQVGLYRPRPSAFGRAVNAASVSGGHGVDAGQRRVPVGPHELIHVCLGRAWRKKFRASDVPQGEPELR
ncbi:unnamed protein product, partial [Laminaria digitata]